MKYSIYRNLRNKKLSIKSVETGLVVGHCDYVEMQNVKFKVNANGIARIRSKQRKEVCAVVQGGIAYMKGFIPREGRTVQEVMPNLVNAPKKALMFNPYRNDSFVDFYSDEAVYSSEVCTITKEGQILYTDRISY